MVLKLILELLLQLDLLLKTGNGGYTSHAGGNYVYCDATNAAVRKFYADMTADLVRNYTINGIQYDDHMSLPSGFAHVDALSHSQHYRVMEDFMTQIKNSVKAARRNAIVSYSPSTIEFSQSHHNVDWENYLQHGVVDEIVPQYYRSSSNDYKIIINRDIPRLHGHQTSLIGGIRLSGSGPRTPAGEVQKMIDLSYARVSFWFGDDIITGVYKPPKLLTNVDVVL
ncbi:hypothetical protein LOTGIDRAFT_163095 [Lottia gigantea]|uniref:Glycosyl hydrolase-like 10 domain-containing protein n=1 Tax=Lottia gigantea TaxID=225164 RepID=V4BSQ8_LOTGI|nr:hypothetical protein LOTGIDRAFT_163095 [Lottia gigantea]ESO92089.1 hypothetical protein LOTGIDRAFT_163095 [Lottia gigantea]